MGQKSPSECVGSRDHDCRSRAYNFEENIDPFILVDFCRGRLHESTRQKAQESSDHDFNGHQADIQEVVPVVVQKLAGESVLEQPIDVIGGSCDLLRDAGVRSIGDFLA